ncbi:hypothetical protein BKA66DRAFT_245357 [Pyrenochaeta sp. MPI-SDFR-AT-0127]|nr:hypothetical protein BKA66DRAFT_245357 [Pyrenochaeta sp. MPI-SDFR-AT-0127]
MEISNLYFDSFRWILLGVSLSVIISLPGDFQFIFRRRFNYATVLFIVNRASCIITLTNSWLFTVYTGSQCLPVYKLAVLSESVTIFTSQALLLIRVRVLYHDNLYLLTFMILFLFASPVFALTEAIITTASNLPGNVGCIFGPSSPYIYLIFLLQALFDCLCFVLCMYKLFRIGKGGGFMSISREMLNGGLVYYIPNVITQIATIILTQQKGSDAQFLSPPAADGVASAQALRITRNLWRSGQKQKHQIQVPTSLTPLREQSTNPTSDLQRSATRNPNSYDRLEVRSEMTLQGTTGLQRSRLKS